MQDRDVIDYKEENNSNIFKSLMNIESKLYRRSERNKNRKVNYYFISFYPKLDFALSNPVVCSSKITNKTCIFREMLK